MSRARVGIAIAFASTLALISWAAVSRVPTRGDENAQTRRAGYLAEPLPRGLDTLVTLAEIAGQIHDCANDQSGDEYVGGPANRRLPGDSAGPTAPYHGCAGVIYVWSPLLPLSRLGIRDILSAAADLGLPVALLGASSLYEHHERAMARRARQSGKGTRPRGRPTTDSMVRALIAAGATIHYPAVVLHKDRRVLGSAIVGYKRAATYRRMLERKLASATLPAPPARGPSFPSGAETEDGSRSFDSRERMVEADTLSRSQVSWADLSVSGRAGAYFRWVPGTNWIAFESEQTIYLLDLEDGRRLVAPGYIDFVPTPDGRFFVTPGPERAGLYFFDARRVFEAARDGTGRQLPPLFIDEEMRDQYPSVAILDSEAIREGQMTVYRVLTSWHDQVIFRDYEFRDVGADSLAVIRPKGRPMVACSDHQLSIPMLSKDGSEVAGRDEEASTTKIFRLDDDGTCKEVLDLGIQTGKVAFGPGGRRVAFAVPHGVVRHGRGTFQGSSAAGELAGIFVLDRKELRITRVAGSEEVNRLAFPDFVGRESIIFLISEAGARNASRFRLVCCVR